MNKDILASLVNAELQDIVNSRSVPLYRMMAYHMGWSDAHGLTDDSIPRPRTHGVMCLMACQAVGGEPDKALPAAAAVELVDNFTEIHDDIQSGTPQRDGRDAVWWVWGPAQAINAGDGMHALARLALFRLLDKKVPPETTFKAVQFMDEASLDTCEARFLDLEAQERIDLTVEKYLDMARGKTGSLLSCAMRLGALVGDADEETIEAAGTFGSSLGVARQIRADLRELWGSDADGSASTEVMNKKKLLPVVYALEKATISEKRQLGDIYFKRVLEPQDVVRVREVLEGLGVRDECEGLVQQYLSEAVDALNVPGMSEEGRAAFGEFARGLVE